MRELGKLLGVSIILVAGCGGGGDESASGTAPTLCSVEPASGLPGETVTVRAEAGEDARFTFGGVHAVATAIQELTAQGLETADSAGCEASHVITLEIPQNCAAGSVDLKAFAGTTESNALSFTCVSETSDTDDEATTDSDGDGTVDADDFDDDDDGIPDQVDTDDDGDGIADQDETGANDDDDGGFNDNPSGVDPCTRCTEGQVCDNGQCRNISDLGCLETVNLPDGTSVTGSACVDPQICDTSENPDGVCVDPPPDCFVDDDEATGGEEPDFVAEADETRVFSAAELDRLSYGAIRLKSHPRTTDAYVYGTFPVTKISAHTPPDDPAFWDNPAFANTSWTGRYLVRPAFFDFDEAGVLVPWGIANGDLVECQAGVAVEDPHYCEGLDDNFDLEAIEAAVQDGFIHGTNDGSKGRVYRLNFNPTGEEGSEEFLFQLREEHHFVPVAHCGVEVQVGEKVEVEAPGPMLESCEVRPYPYAPFIEVTARVAQALQAKIHVDYRFGTGDFMLDLLGQESARAITEEELRDAASEGVSITRYIPMKTAGMRVTCSAVGVSGEEADAYEVTLESINYDNDLGLNATNTESTSSTDSTSGCANAIQYGDVDADTESDDDLGQCNATLDWNFRQRLTVTQVEPAARPGRKAIAVGNSEDYQVPWTGRIRLLPYAKLEYDTGETRWEGVKKLFDDSATCQNSGAVFEFEAADYTKGGIRTSPPDRVFDIYRGVPKKGGKTPKKGGKTGGKSGSVEGIQLVCNDDNSRCQLTGTHNRQRKHETCNYYTLSAETIGQVPTPLASSVERLSEFFSCITGGLFGGCDLDGSVDGEPLHFAAKLRDLRYRSEFRIAESITNLSTFPKITAAEARDTRDFENVHSDVVFEDPEGEIIIRIPWEGQHLLEALKVEVEFLGKKENEGLPRWFTATGGSQIKYAYIVCLNEENSCYLASGTKVPGTDSYGGTLGLRTSANPAKNSYGYGEGFKKQGDSSPSWNLQEIECREGVHKPMEDCIAPSGDDWEPAYIKIKTRFRTFKIRITARGSDGKEYVRERSYERADSYRAADYEYGFEDYLSLDYVGSDELHANDPYLLCGPNVEDVEMYESGGETYWALYGADCSDAPGYSCVDSALPGAGIGLCRPTEAW